MRVITRALYFSVEGNSVSDDEGNSFPRYPLQLNSERESEYQCALKSV